MSNNTPISPKIHTVKKFLSYSNLRIPNYQRPYKWEFKNVQQLLLDIERFSDKEAYRLGTVVLHHESLKSEAKDVKNIVDGQQRTITLLLLVKALIEKLKPAESLIIKELPDLELRDEISKRNVRENYQEIKRLIKGYDTNYLDCVLNKCQVVVFELYDISEAFQFFDSQNARGKDLEPHDLLKAFHLREFSHSIVDKMPYVNQWEGIKEKELRDFFSNYLFRLRMWSKKENALFFTKNQVGLFKGISLESESVYPFLQSYVIAHHYLNDYNNHSFRNIDKQKIDFPFQLDGHIINGERFFEFVSFYYKKLAEVQGLYADASEDDLDDAKSIMAILKNYGGRWRTGDKHIRMLFNCAILYFADRFGDAYIMKFIPRAFTWAYALRIEKKAVSLKSVNKYAIASDSLIYKISRATSPQDIMQLPMTKATKQESRVKHLDKIIDKFETLDCYV